MRVLQGHRVGAVQDAPRENTDAQRHDARPARRQDEMRSVRQAAGAILSCKPERHARVRSKDLGCPGPGETETKKLNKAKAWTSGEDERLRQLIISNASVIDIAADLGRTVKAVRARALRLRIALGRSRAQGRNADRNRYRRIALAAAAAARMVMRWLAHVHLQDVWKSASGRAADRPRHKSQGRREGNLETFLAAAGGEASCRGARSPNSSAHIMFCVRETAAEQ